MNELQTQVKQAIAALWESAHSIAPEPAVEERLRLLATLRQAKAQLAGLELHVLEEARLSGADAVIDEVRHSVETTSKQASASLRLATELADRFPIIARALNEAVISLPQAEAIVAGLRKLPGRLTRVDLEQCQRTILEHVETLGPAELRTLAARLVEVIDPDHAEADEAQRLAAEERAARRQRFLRLSPDFHGSVRIAGQLPVADAALLSAQLESLMPSASSYRDADELPSPDMRRADALVLLAQAAAASGEMPAHGGDRPRVHVTLDYETLTSGLGHVGLLGNHGADGLSAGDARRLACDAGLIPMVLGSASQPLDVGREQRLFTAPIRAALTQRDRGCAFPGCSASPASCEAHHIQPWWAGGESALHNGVLLCPHHHRHVEPDPQQSAESQWAVALDPETGIPKFAPPRHIDPKRRPRQHQRFVLRELELELVAETSPPSEKPPAMEPLCPREVPDLEELIRRSADAWGQAV